MAEFLMENLNVVICVVVICVVICALHFIFKNPFNYPYFYTEFDVSRKRNVDIMDYVDRFLCDQNEWRAVVAHKRKIEDWKDACEDRIEKSIFRSIRRKQYYKVLDDENAYKFFTYREQTRYEQHNYVKQAYKTTVDDNSLFLSWHELRNRHERLARIGFEATLKEYHSKNQRRLMSPELRRMIMERDNYTCQICGKYMPDEVGLHIDHIIPVAAGGKSAASNLQVLCSKCNGRKGARY